MNEVFTELDMDNKIILTEKDIEELRFNPIYVVPSEEESESLKNYITKKCVEVMKYIIQELTKFSNNLTSSYYFVFKMLYLADREHLRKYHKLIVPDNYIKMEFGPVPSLCYDIVKFVKDKNKDNFDESIREEFVVLKNCEVKLLKEPNYDYLSQSNIDCINEAIKKYSKLDLTEIVKLTHDEIYHSVIDNCEITVFHIARGLDKLYGENLEGILHEIYGNEYQY